MSIGHQKGPVVPVIGGLLVVASIAVPSAHAFNFGDMMNPGRWFGGGDEYDEEYPYDEFGPVGPYGPPMPPHGGYGPYGAPFGAPYGGTPYGGTPYGGAPYGGAPYGGYGPPGYGGPGAYPGAQQQRPAVRPDRATSSSTGESQRDSREIEALKRRIDELEAQQRRQQRTGEWDPRQHRGDYGATGSDWDSAPPFRPRNNY